MFNVLPGEGLGAVLLFFGAQDVGGAAIAGEQVLAVLGFEQLSERLDPADDHEKIVLPRQREHRIDQIVARAFFAEVDFQAIGEEGEEVDSLSRRGLRRARAERSDSASDASKLYAVAAGASRALSCAQLVPTIRMRRKRAPLEAAESAAAAARSQAQCG